MSKHQLETQAQKSRSPKKTVKNSIGKNPVGIGLQFDEGGFNQFLEAMPDGLVIVNDQGKIQYVNTQVVKMFGYQPEELLGKPVEILVPDRFDRHKEYREGYVGNLDTRPMGSELALFAVRKDGTEFVAVISLSPWKIVNETYIIAAIRNVTLQKLSEKQLNHSLKLYQQTLDNMLEGCQIIDFDWRYIYINDIAASQKESKPERILMHTMMEVNPGVEDTELFGVLRHCMEERVSRQVESRFKNSDGTSSWFKLSIHPVSEGIFILSINITKRKQAEEALAKSEKRFRALVEKSMEEVTLVNADGTLIFNSPSTRRPLGYPPNTFVGKNLFELFHPDDVAGARDLLEQVVGKQGSHREARFRLRHLNGSWRWLEAIVTNLLDEPSVEAIVVNYRDVTERWRAQEELFRSNERYRTLFEDSPVALWEEDFSKVKQRIELLRQQGVTDFEAYFSSHPEVVSELASLVRVVDVNKSAVKLQKAQSKEELLSCLTQAIGPDAIKHFKYELQCVAEGRTQYNWEGPEADLRGGRIDVRVTWAVAPGYEESFSKVIVSIMDMTESKKAEEERARSEERYRTLFEDSPISLWEEDFSAAKQYIERLRQQGVTDFQDYFSFHPEAVVECAALVRIVDVNKAAVNLHRAKSKEDLFLNLAQALGPETLISFKDELVCVAEGHTQYNWEGPETTLSGEKIIARISWSVIPGYEESLSKVIVSIIDITERKQVEEALSESKLLFHLLIESLPQNIYAKDIDGRFIFANQHYCAIQGRSLEELVGKTDFDLHLPELAEKYRKDDRQVIETGQPIEIIEEHQPLGEKKFFVQVIKSPLYNSKGQTVGILGIFWDITPRMEAEEEIRSRTEEVQTLYALSRSLAEANDLDEILNLINRHAVESVHTTFARIALLEDDNFVMRAAFPIRIMDHGLLVGKREPVAKLPFCQHILKQNKSVILQHDNREIDSYEREALLLDFAQSVCVVPLQVGTPGLGSKQKLGLLMLGESRNEGREPFTPSKILLAESIGDQAASAIRRMLLHQQTERRLQQITVLRGIDQSITSSFSLDLSLGMVLTQVIDQLNVDATTIWVFNPESNMLEYFTGRGFQSELFNRSKTLRLGEGYAGRTALEHSTVHISNLAAQDDNPRLAKAVAKESFVSYFGVPLIAKGSIKGVLEVFHRDSLKPDEEWLGFLDTLAGQAAIAIDNTTLFDNLQRSNADLIKAYDTTLEGWSAALDLRDKETEGHTQRVTSLTLQLAETMGFNEQELVQIRRGALLHDMGKLGVPDQILHKPGKLDDEEWKIMRMHPTYAYQILYQIVYLHPALNIPYCHHEKWDGTGYPRRLKGEEIPFEARIFAVVDIFDALTSDRPYRKGWTPEKTLDYIREISGTHLDSRVVEAFLKMASASY